MTLTQCFFADAEVSSRAGLIGATAGLLLRTLEPRQPSAERFDFGMNVHVISRVEWPSLADAREK
jgi:hypothetical protein